LARLRGGCYHRLISVPQGKKAELFAIRGRPGYIRSDNGPEFACKAVRQWLKEAGVGTLFIEAGSPWENGYIESFNGKLEDECLNGELFLSLAEARYVVDRWRVDYNHHRPHSRLDWMTPAAFSARCRGRAARPCVPADSATHHPSEHMENALAWLSFMLVQKTGEVSGHARVLAPNGLVDDVLQELRRAIDKY